MTFLHARLWTNNSHPPAYCHLSRFGELSPLAEKRRVGAERGEAVLVGDKPSSAVYWVLLGTARVMRTAGGTRWRGGGADGGAPLTVARDDTL